MSELKISEAIKDVVDKLCYAGWPNRVMAHEEIQLTFNKELDRLAGPLVEALELMECTCDSAFGTHGATCNACWAEIAPANYRKERGE